jgi:hypothetical protein
MKRNAKRLTLNRETLRYLDPKQMTVAGGGESGRICPVTYSCFVSYCTCPTTTITQDTCPTECGQGYCYAI